MNTSTSINKEQIADYCKIMDIHFLKEHNDIMTLKFPYISTEASNPSTNTLEEVSAFTVIIY